jgi:8-oxo-dGTP pyrophosphatase MutT (NUDIX family)
MLATKAGSAAEERRQYAALPYRCNDGVEILLISSRETRRWVLPKGWPMKGRKPHAAAAREAMEEAGLIGKISHRALGVYHYNKRLKNGANVWCEVVVFPMRVEKQRKSWPEKDQRTTRWFPLADAADAVAEPDLKAVILAFAAFVESAQKRP